MDRPFYWKARKGWYVKTRTAEGKRQNVRLGETRQEADEVWTKLREEERRREAAGPDVPAIINAYLSWAERQVAQGQLKQRTLDVYLWYLVRFVARYRDLPVSELAPHHLTTWLGENEGWGASAERAAIGSVKRALNWAVDEGRIPKNPLARMRRPTPGRRSHMIESDDHAALVAAAGAQKYSGRIDRQFRLVLIAIRHCGGRPQDVAQARVEFVDKDVTTWTLPEHKTMRKTLSPRIVYLSPCLQTITRMLAAGRTSGPLFRNRRGALSVNAITCRMKRLRKELGMQRGTVAYAYRHTYITEAMVRGVDVATIAELTGTSVEMIQRHYGHLNQRSDHLRKAAAQAVSNAQDEAKPNGKPRSGTD